MRCEAITLSHERTQLQILHCQRACSTTIASPGGGGRKTTGSGSIDGPYLTKALALLHKTTIRLLQHRSLDLQTHDVIQRGIVQANALTRMLCHVEWIKRKIPNI